MNRGEVFWVEFGPTIGGEIQKRRPAIIVSNDVSNRVLNRVQVVPLTRAVSRVSKGEALVALNGEQRKALSSQVTTAAKERLLNRAGRLSAEDLERVEDALRIQLDL
jgi:mRNA interferase MazF